MLTREEMRAALAATSDTMTVQLDGVAFPITICKVSLRQYREMRESCRVHDADGSLVLDESGEPEVDVFAVAAHMVAAGTTGLDLSIEDVQDWPLHRVMELSDHIAEFSKLAGSDAAGEEAAALAETFPDRDARGESHDGSMVGDGCVRVDATPVGRVDANGDAGSVAIPASEAAGAAASGT